MKKGLLLVALGLIIGGAVYIALRKKGTKEGGNTSTSTPRESQIVKQHSENVMHSNENEKDAHISDEKERSVSSINSLHGEAASLMRDSVSAIKENIKSDANVDEDLNDISDRLKEI